MSQESSSEIQPHGPKRRTRSAGDRPVITVVLVEDHVSYRESFNLALSYESDFMVIGQAGSAREACSVIAEREPDLVVIDFMLPDGNGASLARELRRRHCQSRILILGRVSHPMIVDHAMKRGRVSGFILKQDPLADIFDAMRRVARGDNYLSEGIRARLWGPCDEESALLGQLSEREREILFLLLGGCSSKEIAAVLFVSAKTVDAHRSHINRKLLVRSPAMLARQLADQGLTP